MKTSDGIVEMTGVVIEDITTFMDHDTHQEDCDPNTIKKMKSSLIEYEQQTNITKIPKFDCQSNEGHQRNEISSQIQ